MLGQHVERADARGRRVLRILGDRTERGGAFQHLEAVGRNQHAFRGLVHAVIGAADALQKPRSALRRADIDHEIDVAPVDAEIERGGGDHRAQPADRHRGLDLAALRDIERAVMQRDGEAVVVDAPQLLEDAFGLAAGVDEDERGLVALDQAVDFVDRVMRRMPGPRQPLGGVEHAHVGRGAGVREHEIGERGAARALRHQIAAQVVGLGHRRRQADAGEVGRQREQSREAKRQQIAALADDQRVQLVEHDAPERAEQERRVGRGQDQRKLLGRGEQDVRRVAALALALRGRRVAGAGLDADRQRHLGDRPLEVARDVDRERLERRDVERVQPALAADVAAGGDEPARDGARSLPHAAPVACGEVATAASPPPLGGGVREWG